MKFFIFNCMVLIALSKANEEFTSEDDLADNDENEYEELLLRTSMAKRISILNYILGAPLEQFPCTGEATYTNCDGCQRLVTCAFVATNQFTKSETKCSGSNAYCLATTVEGVTSATCSNTSPNPMCDGTAKLPFPCTGKGVFPDPFFCDRYYECKKENAHGVSVKCPAGYVFNLNSAQCDILRSKAAPGKVATDPGCNNFDNIYPVPLCTKLTDGNSLMTLLPEASKPVYFYVCQWYKKRLYPFVYKCLYGQDYEATRGCK